MLSRGNMAPCMKARSTGCRFRAAGIDSSRSGLTALCWLAGLMPAARVSGSRGSLRGPITSSPVSDTTACLREGNIVQQTGLYWAFKSSKTVLMMDFVCQTDDHHLL